MAESWIWGRRPVLEALEAGVVQRILIAAGRPPSEVLERIRREAPGKQVPIKEVPRSEIERIARGANTQGIAALIIEPRVVSVSELIAGLRPDKPAFIIVLDQVQDPQNVGSLIRTAEAAGVDGFVLPERRSAPLSGAVMKASAGAAARLRVAEATNLVRALETLREAGVWTLGLVSDARQSIYEIDLRSPFALVLGSEESGLRRLTREHCDFLAALPMFGHIGSLNVSAAGAIAMYEVVRQRQSLE